MDNSSSQSENTPKTSSWWIEVLMLLGLSMISIIITPVIVDIFLPEPNPETSTPSSDVSDYYHDPYPTRIQDESPNTPSQQTDHSLWAVVIMAVSSLAIVAIITLGIVGIVAILFKQPEIFNALLNGICEFCKNLFKGIFWFFAGKN